jgi:hypothetical protein
VYRIPSPLWGGGKGGGRRERLVVERLRLGYVEAMLTDVELDPDSE